ncbi:ABC transporter ATP-binding protein [Nocardioides endophyticus]|uniref:ABC transporter ATP-binding protein n=1 Tax=Nocardioides endophyticus TaxID=1353775 RepID=A0ABP8YGR8_9ACTN
MTLLKISGLSAGYGQVSVLHDIDLTVEQGELVTVIGTNGAGKTTLLRTISGLMKPSSGAVHFDGRDVTRLDGPATARAGIAHVPENRRVFTGLSVFENLKLGGFVARRDRKQRDEDLTRLVGQFPILEERRNQAAGSLSGGEQQMLAIAMALMARPKLLILDEPSLGLAPLVTQRVFDEIERLHREGVTILLVEQLANQALQIADRGVVLKLGHVAALGTARELMNDESVQRAYL